MDMSCIVNFSTKIGCFHDCTITTITIVGLYYSRLELVISIAQRSKNVSLSMVRVIFHLFSIAPCEAKSERQQRAKIATDSKLLSATDKRYI